MNGMIFAAGLGSRLAPLTDDKPKALVKINGKTLLENAIQKLKNAGCSRIIINVFHFADLVEEYLKVNNFFGTEIVISNERAELLDTGGGLKKATPLFKIEEPIILYNVDVVSNIDLKKMVEVHFRSDAMVTLAVKERNSSRALLFNKNDEMMGKVDKKRNLTLPNYLDASIYKPIPFSGIHVIDYDFLELIEEKGTFSIIDSYINLCDKNIIKAYQHNSDDWMDCGRYDEVKEFAS